MADNDPRRITEFAPAKINLYLHVTGQRGDGYHLLDSLIVFADCGDEISVAPAEDLSLTIDGPFAARLSTGDNNLVIQAARLLAELVGIMPKADITLSKNLPVASGIGGGSADAAATLRALSKLWQVSPSESDLREIAVKLGADVPVCLAGTPSIVGGIGDNIKSAPRLPKVWLVLANPGIAVSTPEVFAQRSGEFSRVAVLDSSFDSPQELATALLECRNDLATPAQKVAPEIATALTILNGLPGQLLNRLSGSGATCFALFADESTAQASAKSLQSDHPDWWIQTASLLS